MPNNYIQPGASENYVFSFTMLSFNGKCTSAIAATNGSTVLFSGKAPLPYRTDASNTVSVTYALTGYSGPHG